MNKLFTKIAGLALGAVMAVGVGVAVASNAKEAEPVYATDTTYTFTSKSWADSSSSWTSDKDGGQLTSGQGVQVTTTYSGAGAHTKSAINNITAIEITYCTNSSKGVGSISVTIGSNAAETYSVTKTGGTSARSTSHTYSTAQSGVVTFSVTCTQNSIYVAAIKITTQNSIPTTSVDVTPASVTLAPNDTQQLTTTVLPANTTDTLTYSTSNSSVATVSSSGLITAKAVGTATITATSGNYSDTCVVTVAAPTTPTISLSASSLSGYTGQAFSVTATYSNLSSAFAWSESGTGTISGSISSTGTSTDGTSTYSGTLTGATGAGTKILSATGGGATTQTYEITITKTAFSTSPAASASVAEGKTTTLTAALNSGGTINWESDDTSVATVTATGTSVTVTGVEEGSTTITASSADDPSVTAECTVTVTAGPGEITVEQSDIESFTTTYTFYNWSQGTISGKIKAYKNSTNIQFGSVSSGVTRGVMYNEVAVPGPITGITLNSSSGTKTFNGYFSKDTPITSCPDSGAVATTDGTWTVDAADEYHYFYFERTGTSGACNAASVTISYEKVKLVDPTGIALNDSSAISMDTYGFGRRLLKANVLPANNNDPTVHWGTSNSSVVEIADGVLTAVGVGTTTVYATTGNYVSDIATPELKQSVTVTVTQALYDKATFVATSTSAATQTDDYLPSGSVTVTSSGTYNNEHAGIQLTSGNTATFTISGYERMKITGIDLVMSSNGSGGGGSLSVTAGSTNLLTIESATFSDETWYGTYEASPVDIYRATTEYVVGSGENIVFSFAANANSLYVSSVAIRYLDYSLEQWCENFLDTITCSGSGSITDASMWDDLGIEFLDLSEELQHLAANATANKDSESVIEQAMARYDAIVSKYGTDDYEDYIGRFGPGTVNGSLNNAKLILNSVGSTNTVVIIVAVSMLSIAAVGGYFFLRKRKEI